MKKFKLRKGIASLIARGRGKFIPPRRDQNPAGDRWPRSTSPTSVERLRQLGNIFINTSRFSLPLQWLKYHADHGETSACFGGVNLFLPRASPGLPISSCLNFFTPSGGLGGFFQSDPRQIPLCPPFPKGDLNPGAFLRKNSISFSPVGGKIPEGRGNKFS